MTDRLAEMNRERQKEGGSKHTSLSDARVPRARATLDFAAPLPGDSRSSLLIILCASAATYIIREGQRVARGVWRGPVERGRETNLTGDTRLRRALAPRLQRLDPEDFLRIGGLAQYQGSA